jgi:hypothetical protein
MGNRVHSGPVPSRQGWPALDDRQVPGSGVALDTDLAPGMLRGALLAPAAHAGYVRLGQLGHRINLPGGG